MNLNLKNKKALVTGSSHGIGLEIAKCLSREGCVVAINGRNNKKLLRASKLVSRSFPIQGDVTNYKIAKKVICRFSKHSFWPMIWNPDLFKSNPCA